MSMSNNTSAKNTSSPTSALPTTAHASPAALIKATVAAVGAAALVLVLFVLPAEAGVDPTGLGSKLGITGMGMAAEQISTEVEISDEAPAVPSRSSIENVGEWRQDEMAIELPPHSGSEIKAHMASGDSFIFAWTSIGGPVKVDMHGEPIGAKEDEFTSYWEERQVTSGQGHFTAPFDGTHGWYWRNKGDTPVTVKVRVSGYYKDLFRP